jgi:hypothetical protein
LFIFTYSSYRAVNTFRLDYEDRPVTAYSETIAACSEIQTKHINTIHQQSAVFSFAVKPGGLITHIGHTGLCSSVAETNPLLSYGLKENKDACYVNPKH